MDLKQRTLRVGLMAILCAMVFRLCSMDLPEIYRTLARELMENTKQETGQNVRFSPSLDTYFPNFVETPPPFTPEPAIPVFSGEEAVELTYACSAAPDIPALLSKPLQWDLRSGEPAVLILHTHTTESYTQSEDPYVQTAAYRTLDEGHNMLCIGALTARLLNEQGIVTLHDRTLHDYPSYNGSYVHARRTVEELLAEYPGIRLVLDLHRDASEGTFGQLRTLAVTPEEPSAQLMVVIGTNHKGYEENLSLGLKLHAQLERLYPGITRPLQLRGQRFNQDLSPGALLIEVGAAGNTRSEALAAARYLAEAVISLAAGTAPAEAPATE